MISEMLKRENVIILDRVKDWKLRKPNQKKKFIIFC